MKLDPKSRIKLAERLLASLDELSEQESTELWAAEAQRRDADLDTHPESGRAAEDVFRYAFSKVE